MRQTRPASVPVGAATRPALPAPPAPRVVVIASYVLMAVALLGVMLNHLLVGLLCVCVGFLATRWFVRLLNKLLDAALRRKVPAARAPWLEALVRTGGSGRFYCFAAN